MCSTNKWSASHCRAANSRATVKERMCVAWWKRASSERSAKVEWGFWLKCNETWHNVLPKKLIFFFFFYLSLTSSKRRQVCERVCVCVFVLKEQGPFNHRKAKCSTSLHGIHHHSPVLPDPSIFTPSFLTPPLPLPATHPAQIHTHNPQTISCQWSMPPKQSSFSSGFIIPKGSGKKVAERALYKARGRWWLTSGWTLQSALARSLQSMIMSREFSHWIRYDRPYWHCREISPELGVPDHPPKPLSKDIRTFWQAACWNSTKSHLEPAW